MNEIKVGIRSGTELDPEHAASADGAVGSDAALHELHQSFADHEADAGAFLPRGFFAKTIEGLKQL